MSSTRRGPALPISDKRRSAVGDAQDEMRIEQFRTCSSPVRDLLNPGSTPVIRMLEDSLEFDQVAIISKV